MASHEQNIYSELQNVYMQSQHLENAFSAGYSSLYTDYITAIEQRLSSIRTVISHHPGAVSTICNAKFIDWASRLASLFASEVVRFKIIENPAAHLFSTVNSVVSLHKEWLFYAASDNITSNAMRLIHQKYLHDTFLANQNQQDLIALSEMVIQIVDFLACVTTLHSALAHIADELAEKVFWHHLYVACSSDSNVRADSQFFISAYFLLTNVRYELGKGPYLVNRCHVANLLGCIEHNHTKRHQILDIVSHLTNPNYDAYGVLLECDVASILVRALDGYTPMEDLAHITSIISTIGLNGNLTFENFECILKLSLSTSLCQLKKVKLDWCCGEIYKGMQNIEACCGHVRQCKETSMVDFQSCGNCEFFSKLADLIHLEIREKEPSDIIDRILQSLHPYIVKGILNIKKQGKAALFLAVCYSKTNLCSLFLEKYGTSPGVLCSEYKHWSGTISCLGVAAYLRKHEIIDMLCKHGARLNPDTRSADPPLHIACRRTKLKTVKYLVSKGCYPHGRGPRGRTSLMCAYDCPEISKYLLEMGADVNATSYDGTTTLHMAVKTDNSSVVSLLLQHGAVLRKTPCGLPDAYILAALYRSSAALGILLDHFQPDPVTRFRVLVISSVGFLGTAEDEFLEDIKYTLIENSDARNAYKQAVDVQREHNLPVLCVPNDDYLLRRLHDIEFPDLDGLLDDPDSFQEYTYWVLSHFLGKNNGYTTLFLIVWLTELCQQDINQGNRLRRIILMLERILRSEFFVKTTAYEEHVMSSMLSALQYICQLLTDDNTSTELFELTLTVFRAVVQLHNGRNGCSFLTRPYTEPYNAFVEHWMFGIVDMVGVFCTVSEFTERRPVFMKALKLHAGRIYKDTDGNTLLHLLIKECNEARLYDLHVHVELALDAGCDVNARNKHLDTALHLLGDCWHELEQCEDEITQSIEDSAELLLRSGADFDLRNEAGVTGIDVLGHLERFTPVRLSHIKFEKRSLQDWAVSVIHEHQSIYPQSSIQELPVHLIELLDR